MAPHEWKCGVICPVYKEGDMMICGSYRAVTLLCAACEIQRNVLYI